MKAILLPGTDRGSVTLAALIGIVIVTLILLTAIDRTRTLQIYARRAAEAVEEFNP